MPDEVKESAEHWDAMYAAPRSMTWHSNRVVADYISNRLFGRPGHWIGLIFDEILRRRPRRLLSIGCGSGEHELAIARKGLATEVHAFDASQFGISKASALAKSEGLQVNFFVDTFNSFIRRDFDQKFDAVLFIGSLHHVEHLNDMLEKVEQILTPDGNLIYNEYVGPAYIVLPDERVKLVNKILNSIPKEFKKTENAQWRNPTIEEIKNTDPSESVRSSLIPQFLRLYFDIEWEKSFGGAILHPIFQMLATDRLKLDDDGARAVASLLAGFEQVLEDQRLIPADFVLGVARHRMVHKT